MPHQVFRCQHRVSYAECTAGNHVYHARYLDILERARGEFFRSLGYPLLQLQNQDLIFPVTGCELKFRAMARYDDLLTVELWVTEQGRVRWTCSGTIKDASGTALFESVVRLACTTVAGKPQRIPGPLATLLAPYTPQASSGT